MQVQIEQQSDDMRQALEQVLRQTAQDLSAVCTHALLPRGGGVRRVLTRRGEGSSCKPSCLLRLAVLRLWC